MSMGVCLTKHTLAILQGGAAVLLRMMLVAIYPCNFIEILQSVRGSQHLHT